MDTNARPFVSGRRSMVGCAIVRRLQTNGWGSLMSPTDPKLDQRAVLQLTEVESRLSDPCSAEAKGQLGWAATINLPELICEILATDCDASRRGGLVRPVGIQTYSCVE